MDAEKEDLAKADGFAVFVVSEKDEQENMAS